jgi:hypothetical protein
MLNRLFRAVLVAGAATVTTYAVKYALAERKTRRVRAVRSDRKAAVHDWENEGGAVKSPSPQPTPTP